MKSGSIISSLSSLFTFLILLMLFGGVDCKHNPADSTVLPDTTSHEFSWDIQTFGGGAGSSYLSDIAIVDENNIWSVGQIYVQDSTGQPEQHPYNVVHWNGAEWELNRFQFPICGTGDTAPFPARAVFAFSNNEVWFTSAGTIMRLRDGATSNICIPSDLLTGSINELWGSSPEDVYIVGNLGTILHYDSQNWQKIDSGTDQTINDIWGVFDEQTLDHKIFCAVSSKFQAGEMKILQILPGNVVQEFDWQPQRSMQSIWFGENTPLYTCGDGFFIYEQDSWRQAQDLPKIYKNRVRGNHQFDVFVAGDFGLLAHLNGNSWFVYDSLALNAGSYKGLAISNNIVAAVGYNGDKAVILIGKR